MLWSQSFLKTSKTDPSDAEIPSHKLIIRSGYVKKLSQGIFTYGPVFLRSLRKLENIIREELEAIGSQEILMPMVQSSSVWNESGRWSKMGPELLRFKNRLDQDCCLGATHEEVVTDFLRHDVNSYKDFPLSVFQIQNKYRDEIRPRFGLMRGREFLMKDAYSFDRNKEESIVAYQKFKKAYQNIFDRVGLDYRVVKADSGAMGGSLTEEFQVLAEIGEDELLISDGSDFAANREVCACLPNLEPPTQVFEKEELIETPGLESMEALAEFLKTDVSNLVKTMFFKVEIEEAKSENIAVLMRGSDSVNLLKLKNVLGALQQPQALEAHEVESEVGSPPGSCGPKGLEMRIFADQNLKVFKSCFVGANKKGYHLSGVQPGKDFKIESFNDFRLAQEGDPSPEGDGKLKLIRGIEVGHIFYLGQTYTSPKSLNFNYLDNNGKAQIVEMGCYGIGVGRTLQAAIEQNHDDKGSIWPKAISPYQVHISWLDPGDKDTSEWLEGFVSGLKDKGIDYFIDDRKERPGVKFKDADLLGFPVRVVLGKRGFGNNEVECVLRCKNEKHVATKDEAFDLTLKLLQEAI